MEKMHCDIVKDLLPLYADDVCSEKSKAAIEEHLKECEECRKCYEALTKDLPQVAEGDSGKMSEGFFLKTIKKEIRKEITHKMVMTAVVMYVIFAIGLACIPGYHSRLGFGLFGLIDERVEKNNLKVENLCQLENGKIYFEVRTPESITDLNIDTSVYDEKKGLAYGTAYYSVDWEKQLLGIGGKESNFWFIFSPYEEDDIGNRYWVSQIYFECKNDERIEIWKRGQEIAKASEEIEERVRNDKNAESSTYCVRLDE